VCLLWRCCYCGCSCSFFLFHFSTEICKLKINRWIYIALHIYCKTHFFACPLFCEFRGPGKFAKITGRKNLNTVAFQCSRKQKCQNYGVQNNYIDSNAKIKGSTVSPLSFCLYGCSAHLLNLLARFDFLNFYFKKITISINPGIQNSVKKDCHSRVWDVVSYMYSS